MRTVQEEGEAQDLDLIWFQAGHSLADALGVVSHDQNVVGAHQIIFGEILPKSISKEYAEPLTLRIAGLLWG